MTETMAHHDVPPPATRLASTLACWGGGAGLAAIAVASLSGVSGSASLGVASALGAVVLWFGLLSSMRPRPLSRWAMPLLLAQMVRTGLCPVLGLVVFLLAGAEAVSFWMSLLTVAGAMLAGETLAVARLFGGKTMQEAGA
jgi:hypothetical protein